MHEMQALAHERLLHAHSNPHTHSSRIHVPFDAMLLSRGLDMPPG